MTTPSADIMSSPDPLNDPDDETIATEAARASAAAATPGVLVPPSTRRVTRSQRSDRFSSVATSSPRRQMFELAVGDEKKPQRLLVTVETDEPDEGGASGARRRLFQSETQNSTPLPMIRRMERATTTTVPLRGGEDDDGSVTTPRRRGRPRKVNGTPVPTTGTKRKAGTPIGRTPRRLRGMNAADTEASPAAKKPPTPKTNRRGRPPKKRATDLSSEAGNEQPLARSARRTSMAVQDMGLQQLEREVEMSDEVRRSEEREEEGQGSTVVRASTDGEGDNAPADAGAEPNSDADEEDIWMATLDDEPTPRVANRTTQSVRATASPKRDAEPSPKRRSRPQQSPAADPESDLWEADDYGDLAPPSDHSSVDEPPSDPRSRNNDTVAQGEDFSMIFMDSIPSLQASFNGNSAHNSTHNVLGEETSLIINRTLEELRQEREQREAANEKDGPAAEVEATELDEPLLPPLPRPSSSEKPQASPALLPKTLRPRLNLSPRWAQSPRRPVASPLRQQLLKSKAQQATGADHGDEQGDADEQKPTKPATRTASQLFTGPRPHLYEDSFSEIPQGAVESATPMRHVDAHVTDGPEEGEDGETMEEGEEGEEGEQPEELLEQREQSAAPTASNASGISRSDAGRLPTPDDTPPQVDFEADEQAKSAQASQPSSRLSSPAEEDPLPELPEASSDDQVQESDRFSAKAEPDVREPINQEDEYQHQYRHESDHDGERGDGHEGEKAKDLLDRMSVKSVPDIMEELMDDDEAADQIGAESALDTAHSQQPRLSTGARVPQMEVTPANQLSSPVQEPQSLLAEAHQDKNFRPALSPIVRAGRVLQNVTSDPPSPEARDLHLRSPFRSSVSRDSRPASQDNSQGRPNISASPQRPFSLPPALPSSAKQTSDDPFGSASKHTGQARFMDALNRSVESRGPLTAQKSRSSSKDSPTSSMRIAPPSDGELSWVAREGPISAHLRGDNSLKDLAALPTTEATGHSTSHQVPDGEAEADTEEPPEDEDDDMDIWEIEAQREEPAQTRQRSFGRKTSAPVQRRSTVVNLGDERETEQPRSHGAASRRRREQEAEPEKETEQLRSYGAASRRRRELEAEPEPELEAEPELEPAPETESEPEAEHEAEPEPEPMEVSEAETNDAFEFSMLVEKEIAERQKAPPSAHKASRFDLSSFFSSPAAIPGMLADKFLPAKTKSIFGSRTKQPEEAAAAPTLPTNSMFPPLPRTDYQPQSSSPPGASSPLNARAAQREPSSPASPSRGEMATTLQRTDPTPAHRQFAQSSAGPSSMPTPPRMQLSHADIQRWQQETSNASDSPPPEDSEHQLRPLPPRGASPSKSSLRSPLKPRTPGRVVEFTSSVLSPVEQARVRQQRHLSNAVGWEDKENQGLSGMPMDDGSKQPYVNELSQRVWTRQHWLFLDELLQLRRQGPFDAAYERRTDKFLGKTVRSQGEAMRLERWHLDCVDAFKAEVGGWDEAILAKRLFALILGEKRRSRGVAARPARVMFH